MGSFASKLISANLSADTRDPVRHPSKNDESKKVTLVVVPNMQSCCDVIYILYVFMRLKLGYHLLLHHHQFCVLYMRTAFINNGVAVIFFIFYAETDFYLKMTNIVLGNL